jgi:tartrate dehydratase alpha subunit/fumarate hydratase class I-like protein
VIDFVPLAIADFFVLFFCIANRASSTAGLPPACYDTGVASLVVKSGASEGQLSHATVVTG